MSCTEKGASSASAATAAFGMNHHAHCSHGAFGYSGRYITKRLLEAGHEVMTLTNSMHRPNPFGEKVADFPFHFDEAHRVD